MADLSAVMIVIAGQLVTQSAKVGYVRVDDVLNDAPNSASLSVVTTPRHTSGPFAAHAFATDAFAMAPTLTRDVSWIQAGMPIQIYLGDLNPAYQQFGGTITIRDQVYAGMPKNVQYNLTCVDYTRVLNKRKVTETYPTQSATGIVLHLLERYAPTLTVEFVQLGLPVIDGGIVFTFEEVSRALSRVAEKVGAYWYLDYAGALHFFTGVEPGGNPDPLVPAADGRFTDLSFSADLTQVRTRILVEGMGTRIATTLPTPVSIVPVGEAVMFAPGGGQLVIGTNRYTYTGVQLGGVKTNTTGDVTGGSAATPPPTAPAPPVPTLASVSTPGNLAGGPYRYGATFELSDGTRSAASALSSAVTIVAATAPPGTSAALSSPQAPGPIAIGVTSYYATSYLDARAGETPATITGLSGVTGRVVDPPVGLSVFLVGVAAPGLPIGAYGYVMSYLTPAGETAGGTRVDNQITGANTGFQLYSSSGYLPVSPDTRVRGRRIYRAPLTGLGGAVAGPWRIVLEIPNNDTGILHVDSALEATLSPRPAPVYNSTTDVGESAVVTVPVSSDARVTRRRLYRKDGAGEYRFVAEIPNNTATTYADTVIGGASGILAPSINTLNTGAVQVTGIALGPAGTARRRLFRTTAGGSELREVATLNDNVTTGYLDTEADANLGGSPLPGLGAPAALGTVPPTPIGATSLRVVDYAGFPSSGWVFVGSQFLFYGGVATVGPAKSLTGIPPTGAGSLVAAIADASVVTSAPALVGVAPPLTPTVGDQIQLIVQVDDLSAQAALAALDGSDGIIEHYIRDDRLSEPAARSRGLAELALFKTVETKLRYTTFNPQTRSGRSVHVALPAPTNLTGDFLIQKVTIDDISVAQHWYPRRHVEASSTRFSLEDVLRRLVMEQT